MYTLIHIQNFNYIVKYLTFIFVVIDDNVLTKKYSYVSINLKIIVYM